MIQDLIIYQKSYDLFLYIHPILAKFPKNQRHVLGQRIENKILDIIESIIATNMERNKLPGLRSISIAMDELRTLVRLSKDLEFLSIRQYEIIADKLNEIGRMLSGWINKCLNQKQ
ncbi:MAG: diversity-generating retroelement protein Avd [Candidatus Colwellbacteria bacterium]|nr:diversity-generating retroelement protein Avd [Candidatus Colwellbacteria bacterium]